ncbi:MAG: hypothetical protein ACK4QP_20625 [Pseudorhizobium sp.]
MPWWPLELNTEYLFEKIESLQFVIELILATMPPENQQFILQRLDDYAQEADKAAARSATDSKRHLSTAAYDTKDYFDANTAVEADGFRKRLKVRLLP